MKKNYWVNKYLIISFFLLCAAGCFPQIVQEFAWPIDTPHTVTGNYGELRPNHFHMGWDFSTNGKINYPVYAIANGYVSRIKVSASGYGKALYVSYPGNKVSVYGHLSAYAPAISNVVREEQIAKKSYEIELFPQNDEIMVTKGTLLGYSGNSGNSSGPHLHFEIRDQKTEVPLNLMSFYGLNDTVKPAILQVAFYDLSDTTAPRLSSSYQVKVAKGDSLFIQKETVVVNSAIMGLAFSGFDRFVNKGNPNVIYRADLFLDDQLIFSYALNGISFDDQRYVNEFAETIHKIKYQKCFLPTQYPAGIYANCQHKGRIILNDTNCHHLKLKVYDEFNNQRHLQFYFKTKKINGYIAPVSKGDVFVNCGRDFETNVKGLHLTIPAKALYNSSGLAVSNTLKTNGKLSLLPATLNLATTMKIGFMVPTQLRPYQNKLVLRNGSISYCPEISGDTLSYSVYTLGHFQLEKDTSGPKIKTLLTSKKIRRMKKFTSFSFVMRDNLSGLGKYHFFVNGNWALAEFDAKSNLLTYYFDSETPAGSLIFRIEAEDRLGNASIFSYLLKR